MKWFWKAYAYTVNGRTAPYHSAFLLKADGCIFFIENATLKPEKQHYIHIMINTKETVSSAKKRKI